MSWTTVVARFLTSTPTTTSRSSDGMRMWRTALSNDLDGIVSFSGFALADHIDSGEPPVIIFHGRNDETIPFALAEQTCAAAVAAGITCELVPHDAGHAPAADLSAALDQAIAFVDREMLARAGLADRTDAAQP